MKKKITALAFGILLVAGTAFASNVEVTQKVLQSFQSRFAGAKDVRWVEANNYYRAIFSLNGQNIFAFYTREGELISTMRYISTLNLPVNLLVNLKTGYNNYWVSDLFELNNSTGVQYYITLEDADTILKLVSVSANEWRISEKIRKV
jgi:hypothetical protein